MKPTAGPKETVLRPPIEPRGNPTAKTMVDASPTILAIETTGRNASVALLTGSQWTTARAESSDQANSRENLGPASRRRSSSATLLPMIATLCEKASVQPKQIDAVAVATGPGSFTGLRIGVVTAKTLAWVNQTRLIALDTLECLAWQAVQSMAIRPGDTIAAVMNAQRGQVFVESFRVDNGPNSHTRSLESLGPIQIVDPENTVTAVSTSHLITGPGLKLLVDSLGPFEPDRIAPVDVWPVDVAAVGRLARLKFDQGRFDDPWTLRPNYVRPSYAEE